LQPFIDRSHTPGRIASQPPPHRAMQTFLPDFPADFSTPDGAQRKSRFSGEVKFED
jgi:hypothetical protein